MPDWAKKYANQKLQSLGVEVKLEHLIKKISQSEIYCEGEPPLQYDYLIWVTGIEGENLNKQVKGVELTKKGQISVQPDLSLANHPEVFVVGDLAQVMDPNSARPMAATAWAAISHAKAAAKNVVLKAKQQSTQNYQAINPGFVVTIGNKFAISNLFGLSIKGLIGWVIEEFIRLRYLLSILSPLQAFTIWWCGVKISR